MKKWTILFSLFCAELVADVAVVCDCFRDSVEWEETAQYPQDGKGLSGWDYVNFHLMQKGERLFLTNLQEKDSARLLDPSTSVIIVNNIPVWAREDWKAFLKKMPAKKVLICWEPPVVMPGMYTKETFDIFDIVLTWNTDLVDNKKFFQFYYPRVLPVCQKTLSFQQRGILTQISGCKKFSRSHELYSLRKKAIKFFEKNRKNNFRFYGKGWPQNKFRTYGGSVADKYAVLQKYRFSLCFENMYKIRGYVTEKIFDCFCVKTVPVYFGASDIEKLIPKGCYIRWKDFKSFDKLYEYLEKMPESEYLKYVKNAKKFLASNRAARFTRDVFARTVLKSIFQAKLTKKKHYFLKQG